MGSDPNGDVLDKQPTRWIIGGAVFTLLQSVLLLSGSAVGLSAYTCSLHSTGNVDWQMVRLYYFANIKCSESFVVDGTTYTLAGTNQATYRTVVIISIYTALSSIWIIGSIILLVSAAKGKDLSPVLGKYLHSPWIISMVLIITLDVIASVLYCVDLINTKNFNSVMGMLNIKPDGALAPLNEDNLSTPPWIMALLTSKGVILWIINIIVFVFIIVQLRTLFIQRQQAEYIRTQLATVPAYLWPPKLAQMNPPPSKNDTRPAPTPRTTALPRLVSQDGVLVGQTPPGTFARSTTGRSSALQMAKRQGFTYERSPRPWSLTNPDSISPQRMTTPQKYGYDEFPQEGSEWNRRRESGYPRQSGRPSSILQRDNEIFY